MANHLVHKTSEANLKSFILSIVDCFVIFITMNINNKIKTVIESIMKLAG